LLMECTHTKIFVNTYLQFRSQFFKKDEILIGEKSCLQFRIDFPGCMTK